MFVTQLLSIPFDVTIDCPTTVEVGQVCPINVRIKNKTWKLERMIVKLELHDCFLATGYTSVTIEVRCMQLVAFETLVIVCVCRSVLREN